MIALLQKSDYLCRDNSPWVFEKQTYKLGIWYLQMEFGMLCMCVGVYLFLESILYWFKKQSLFQQFLQHSEEIHYNVWQQA